MPSANTSALMALDRLLCGPSRERRWGSASAVDTASLQPSLEPSFVGSGGSRPQGYRRMRADGS